MKRHLNAGFTLVEALIVLAISIVLAGIAIPMFTNAMNGYYQSATVSATAGAISATRMQAVMHGCSYELIFNPSNLTYQVYSEVPAIGTVGCLTAFSLVTPSVGSATTPLPNAGGVSMTCIVNGVPTFVGGGVPFTFFANGTVSVFPTGATLQIKNTVRSSTISVSGVGYVSTTSP